MLRHKLIKSTVFLQKTLFAIYDINVVNLSFTFIYLYIHTPYIRIFIITPSYLFVRDILSRKSLFFPLILIISAFLPVSGRNTFIETDPYAHGEILIQHTTTNHNYFEWFEDTITFSMGTKITFVYMDQFVTRDAMFLGGLVFLDSTSHLSYKFNESLKKTYNWNPPDYFPGEHTFTINNPDTSWYTSTAFPISLAPCDSFVYFDKINRSTITFYQAKLLFGRYDYTNHPTPYTITAAQENYNAIMYVSTDQGIHFKIQIEKVTIKATPVSPTLDNSELQHIKLRWAVDSLGNGLFKTDSSAIIQGVYSNNHGNNSFHISTSHGIPYLHFSNTNFTNNELHIAIFDLKGKRYVYKHIQTSNPFCLSHLNSGMYLMHIIAGKERLAWNFILSK